MPVSFSVTREESLLIDQIVTRAMTIDPDGDRLHLSMDITACHANGRRLRLADLLAADDFNFTHDVFGIRRHLDRHTGALTNCFFPRFHE